MPNIQLRPYQQKFIDDIRNEFRLNHKRVVGVAPCGAGKTIVTGWMIREAVNRGKRSIFFVHRHELIEQTAKTFCDLDIPFGVIESGFKSDFSLPVQIAAVQTLAKRIDKIPKPDFLICDECHHILANTYKKILDAFPDAFLLGVTATPQRMGGITLSDVFYSMVQSLSVNELIKLGNLTKFRYFAPDSGVDLNNVRSKFGEFVESDLERVMSNKKIIGNIVDTYKKIATEKSAICYCVNVNHSKYVADAFNQAGISAAHVDGDTHKIIRKELVSDFRNGKIKVLCNAELFGEGFDVPRCQAVILARPTKSLTLYIQQAMRSMRPDPDDTNKVAFIIDHVQNYLRHGLPNTVHHWSLLPNPDKISQVPPVKVCPNCKAVVPLGARFCPECNFKFDGFEVDLTEHDGHFAEIFPAQDKKNSPQSDRIQHAFSSPEDFLSFAKQRNYKIGWVAFKALEHANSYEDCLHIADVCGYNHGWAWHKWNEKNNTRA